MGKILSPSPFSRISRLAVVCGIFVSTVTIQPHIVCSIAYLRASSIIRSRYNRNIAGNLQIVLWTVLISPCICKGGGERIDPTLTFSPIPHVKSSISQLSVYCARVDQFYTHFEKVETTSCRVIELWHHISGHVPSKPTYLLYDLPYLVGFSCF